MQIKNVRNPQWANAEHTMINVVLETDVFGEIPFSASPNDVEEHGRAIFADAVAGKFGVIAEYVAPVLPKVVPQVVTRFQAKAALALRKDRDGVSYLSMVETYMATKADEITKLAWTEALSFLRDSPMVLAVAAMLELTPSQIDDLFVFAATIQ